ncbi:OmcA/MtrC family decaheme c-type cytochrome [Motiliproteus sp. SC1-56]|uniref:OmcA/MtrC family decaheme c-type cytochrome n=1 Tax=Motiliproteus sp. SC1-56 TaxID=2799565 RepID=UPI001A8EF784|nr:OmcA/MtrC family decaheme c-type cytochrome [Motiliproteus sp. SC1-56]
MDRKHRPAWRGWLTSLAIATTVALSGCSDDGDDGAVGPVGPPGPAANSEIPETVDASINRATVAADGTLTVEFEILDGLGNGFVGLDPNDIRFTVAQLQEATADGESTKWQSYINVVEEAPDPADDVGPGTVDQVQATFERASAGGTFTDNRDGTYSYTLVTNLREVTAPVAVTFDPSLTHRVGFQLGGGLPATNEVHDWRPSDGATTNLTQRNIVTQDVCNACHGKLELHGTARIATAYCVTCHNPGSTDANSGNTVDFKVMVHKIHRGRDLPSLDQDGDGEIDRDPVTDEILNPYTIWGFRDNEHDYSEIGFPQDIRNCNACHAESNADTPQASNWRTAPSAEACGACHDDVNFADGTNHPAGAQPNSECTRCHGDGTSGSVAPVPINHTGVLAFKEAARDEFVVTPDTASLAIDGAGDVTIDVILTLEGVPVDELISGGLDTDAGAKLGKYTHGPDNGALAINWDDGTGFQLNHFEVDLNDCTPANDGSGRFTCVTTGGPLAGIQATDTITVTTVDSIVCFNEADGTVVRCDSSGIDVGEADVTPVFTTFNGDGTVADPANAYDRVGASLDECQDCHGDKHFHHAATDLRQCKTCHNATRVGFRGLGDLKRHVHRLHSSLDRDALDPVDVEVDAFPNNVDNCIACHGATQFDLPPQENFRASTASDGQGGTVFISPTTVVCGSCHLSAPLGHIDPGFPGYIDTDNTGTEALDATEQALVDHMIQNGAVFHAATFDEANKFESCAVCHAIGSEFGVDTVHTLR